MPLAASTSSEGLSAFLAYIFRYIFSVSIEEHISPDVKLHSTFMHIRWTLFLCVVDAMIDVVGLLLIVIGMMFLIHLMVVISTPGQFWHFLDVISIVLVCSTSTSTILLLLLLIPGTTPLFQLPQRICNISLGNPNLASTPSLFGFGGFGGCGGGFAAFFVSRRLGGGPQSSSRSPVGSFS